MFELKKIPSLLCPDKTWWLSIISQTAPSFLYPSLYEHDIGIFGSPDAFKNPLKTKKRAGKVAQSVVFAELVWMV